MLGSTETDVKLNAECGAVLLSAVVPAGRDAMAIGSLAGTGWVKHESD